MTNLPMRAVLGILVVLIALFSLVQSIPPSPQQYVRNLELSGDDASTLLLASVLDIARERGVAFGVDVVDAAIRKARISSDECHSLLHLLGHEAYIEYGDNLDAIFGANERRICLGGYLHGVEAQMAAEGLGARDTLLRFCEVEKALRVGNGPCFHGVGHSAFEQTHDVRKSLAFCDALLGGPETELWNCYLGIFSELGNALLGVDTNTGEAVQPLSYPGISRERPFALCDTLALKYRDSCYSQLSKVFFQSSDPAASIRSCVSAATTEQSKRYCIESLSGIAGRILLDSSEISTMKELVDGLSVSEQRYALAGLREAYIGYVENGQSFDWLDFCGSLLSPVSQEYCKALDTELRFSDTTSGI